MIPRQWVIIGSVTALIGIGAWLYSIGYSAGVAESTERLNKAWVEHNRLQVEAFERDQKLAAQQQSDNEERVREIIKTEVVYRDRIKTVTVRQCISDSGLFELYNSTLGVTSGQRRPNDTPR